MTSPSAFPVGAEPATRARPRLRLRLPVMPPDRRIQFLCGVTAVAVAGAASIAVGAPSASAAANITFDTGSGLVFTVDGTNGNLTSLKHNGVELASGVAGQFESGWASANVSATSFDGGNSELITADNTGIGVTQYFFARKGDNTIYLATDIRQQLNPGEGRFISRLNSSLLPNSPVAANTSGGTAIEGKDVYQLSDGHTASKFYSSQRLIAQQPFGAGGNGHGVWIIPGTQEMASGGPFFRDIEVNNAGGQTNITAYLFSGHAQTEAMRLGLHGPYAMAVTNGPAPAAGTDLDFLSSYIPGLLSVAQRGTVGGTASGSWAAPATVALAGPNGQYWSAASGNSFSIAKIRPGTYTATLYAGELAVGATQSVTVSAGQTSTLSLSGSSPANGSLFQIGTWDGTPKGLLNADKIETEHPSDPRMSSWTPGPFTATSPASGFPMAMFQGVNSPQVVDFSLSSVPAGGAKLRIGITVGFDNGRPAISIGGYSSPASDSPAPVNLNSRSITRGTWRGVNHTYTFSIPASALHTGSNSLTISSAAGSGGTGYLTPAYVFDALSLDPA